MIITLKSHIFQDLFCPFEMIKFCLFKKYRNVKHKKKKFPLTIEDKLLFQLKSSKCFNALQMTACLHIKKLYLNHTGSDFPSIAEA